MKRRNTMKAIKISNINVYGVEESKTAATYPMSTTTESKPNHQLFRKLFHSAPASGHDCAAKGITIQFDLTAPEYFWRQLDRYHFIDHISSQSKMHRIKNFNIQEMCNEEVDEVVIKNLQKLIQMDAPLRKIMSNVPCGLRMTSRMTTNLLQLKNILNQRRAHRLQEWQEFCNWIDDLVEDLDLM